MNPTISIVISGARPELWSDLYSSIGNNEVSFELIFIGPDKLKYQFPNNVFFIQSRTKPVQCFEIGARLAQGKYLLFLADDTFFCTEHPLDDLYKEYLAHNNEKLMLSCRYGEGMGSSFTKKFPAENHLASGDTTNLVYMPVGFIINRDYYMYLGGLDRNFIALYWDLDLCFRIVEDGGITSLSSVWLIEQKEKHNNIFMYITFNKIDRLITLEKFWPMFGKNNDFKRTAPLELFSDYKILEESQGPKGKWV